MDDFDDILRGDKGELIKELEAIKAQELQEGYTEDEEGDLTDTIEYLMGLPDGEYEVVGHDMGLVVRGVNN